MDDLDALFATAKKNAMQPSEALMLRVLADAEEMQPRDVVLTPAKPVHVGFWARLADVFGGAGALAGVGSAAAAGLFIGFAQPASLMAMTGITSTGGIESVELMPDVSALLAGE